MTLANMNEALQRRQNLSSRTERLARMMEIRAVEERIQKLFTDGYMRGSTHLSNGQEAVAVGVACATQHDDVVTCTYRGHGHALALGATPLQVMGEMCGRVVGTAGGLGGSMHLAAPEVGLLPTFAIVGAGLPVACGAAIAARARNTDRVAVAIFGDGASNIGAFHEALNLAAIRKLPMVFVCENNLYGEYTRIQLSTPVEDIATRAASYAIPGVVVDGQDVDKMAEVMDEAVSRARQGFGPTLVEAKTYRYSGHSRSDPAAYRPAGELDHWLERDPLKVFGDRLVAEAELTAAERESLQQRAKADVDHAAEQALAAAQPGVDQILLHVDAARSPNEHRWVFWR